MKNEKILRFDLRELLRNHNLKFRFTNYDDFELFIDKEFKNNIKILKEGEDE